ncbi:STAS domain-containing protein [Micromonospora sp. NPDC003776]
MSEDPPQFGYHHVPTASGPPRPDEAIMWLACATLGTTKRITVAGEIDMSNAHLLLERVAAVARAPAPLVAVDLSAVTFFGAHGVSALAQAQLLVVERGGRLTLCDPSPVVRRVLALTGTLTAFEIVGGAVTGRGRTGPAAMDRYAPSPPPPPGRKMFVL